MDWKDIKEKYPKAFEKMQKDMDCMYVHQTILYNGTNQTLNIRDLYNFFDKHKIIIAIQFDFSEHFTYFIRTETYHTGIVTGSTKRTEIEKEAFTEAFRLLEQLTVKHPTTLTNHIEG